MAILSDLPEGIFSLLDTDLYKLTMQCAILKYLPDTRAFVLLSLRSLLTQSRRHLRFHEPNPRHAPEQSSVQLDTGTGRQCVSTTDPLTGCAYHCWQNLRISK